MSNSKKIVILGHFGVGKTSLVRRFVENEFSENYKVTIGVHISKKIVDITDKESISLIIWDLEGTDDLSMVRDAYLLGTHGAIFVFDVSRPSTFQNIKIDLAMVKDKLPKAPLFTIGNKTDLVSKDQLETILKEHNIPYDYLTSARTGNAVDKVFNQLAVLANKDA